MELRLILFALAVVALVAASVVALADQSGRLLGVAELTPLVVESIDLDDGAASEWPRPTLRAA